MPKARANNIAAFYDQMSPFYHLIFSSGWEASMSRQAEALAAIIRKNWGAGKKTVLDAACGIGTQALGLASLGYDVTGSDISPLAVERARREARQRRLAASFSTADMRRAHIHHRREFDVVIACDNAVPHLLSDAQILKAFRQFYKSAAPGGGCIISVRDYKDLQQGPSVQMYGPRYQGGKRFFVFQAREVKGRHYKVGMYFVEDAGARICKTHVMWSKYYAVQIPRLKELMSQAGFKKVKRIDKALFQPLIVGHK